MFRTFCLAMLGLAGAATLSAETLYRDPMRPYEAPAEAGHHTGPARYRLSTVLISETRRVAVINGRICRVGDRVDGAEVLAIESEWVRLRVGTKNLVVAFAGRAPQQDREQEAAP